MEDERQRALGDGNLKRFVAFRLFFNARYYYPVFTLLFLDFGLSLEAFAILNIVWALTIVLAEVPSGALADVLGRRTLVVIGAVLMVVEMAVLAFMPMDAGLWTVALFALNRVCSGLAEAMVSGADEALAYDTLKNKGLETYWPDALERAVRWTSAAMGISMLVGAALYDPALPNRVLAFLGIPVELSRETAMRLPLFLSLLHAFAALYAAWGMRETPRESVGEASAAQVVGGAFRNVGRAALWTLDHRFVLIIIIGGVALDSVARQYVIIHAEYLRLIDIPVAAFGIIAACMNLLGILFAAVAKRLVRRFTPFQNLFILTAVLLFGLIGVRFAVPVWGVLFTPFVFAMFTLVAFLQSHYINREVSSAQRATVLSFKGLALNLALAAASLFYTLLVAALRKAQDGAVDEEAAHAEVFLKALDWFPGYTVALVAVVLLLGRRFIRRLHLVFEKG
ncbi:MAG: hypothetical protein JJU00_14550 [Opitutales bacterium]|nr:hypothetical protein [Opitutales bacterium]